MMRASIIGLSTLLLLAAALIALTFLFTPDAPPAQAQATVTPGSLDTTFGTEGKVTTNLSANDSGNAVALQTDGKIVVAGGSSGKFGVARYNPDGTLDTSFSSDGKLTTAIGSGTDRGYVLAIQPNGKILVAGESYNGSNKDFALARYDADGSLDTTFGTVVSGQTRSGKATTAIGSGNDVAYGLALQPDGKIVLAGESHNGTNEDFALVRYDVNGTLDTSFGTGGKVTTSLGGADRIHAIALQPDSKIVAAGHANDNFALARYDADGSLDTSFSSDGKVTTGIGAGATYVNDIALQPDGKIVAAGTTAQGRSFALARYNPDGSLDTNFGTGGKVITVHTTTGFDAVTAVAVQPDGRIVTAGRIHNGIVNEFALSRYNANGTLDTTFGTDGTVKTAFGSGSQGAEGMVLQPDGKIVAAGFAQVGNRYDFGLARYNNAPPPAEAPDTVALVSNHEQTTTGASYGTNNWVNAQAFTTGSSANGYVLTAVDAVLESNPSVGQHGEIRAEIWSAATGGAPDEKVAALVVPDNISSGAAASFAAEGLTLEANTKYFFLIYTTDAFDLRIDFVTTTGEDDGAADGWSIADKRYARNSQTPGGSGTWTSYSNILRVAVKGYALTDPPPQLTGLYMPLLGSTSLRLLWESPLGSLSGYDVHYTSASGDSVGNDDAASGSDSSTAWVDANYDETDTDTNTDPLTGRLYPSHFVTGLTADTTYRLRVRAQNALGAGRWAFITATPTSLIVPPDLAIKPGDGKLSLTWTQQIAGIFWEVHYTSAPKIGQGAVGDQDPASGSDPAAGWYNDGYLQGTPSYTIPHRSDPALDNGTTYRVRVRSTRLEIDEGPWAFITGTPVAPSVTLSASPNPVPEGSQVTVTATLSEAQTGAVDIPVTITDHTAESGDHGALTSITIPAGETTAEAQVTTAQDDDGYDETFTVALGTLPSPLEPGDPSSVKITIRDDDEATVMAVTLVTNAGETVADTDAPLTASSTVAQAFRAGGNANGYTLTGVEVQFANSVGQGARDSMKAQLWSDSGSDTPGAELYDLTVPDAIAAGKATFTAPAGAALAADTTYWFVLWADPITNGLKATASDDQAGESGWTIADTFRDASANPPTGSSTWNAPSGGRSLLLTVRGAATSIWSAALKVQDSGGNVLGCSNAVAGAECSSASVLTDDDFTYNGVDYGVSAILLSGADLAVTLDRAIPTALSLNVDGEVFPATDGALSNSDRTVTWTSAGLGWSPGDTVSLGLAAYCNCSVSLSAAPVEVDDGSPVAITATLSSASPVSAIIPLTIAAGTAESGDYKAMSDIAIGAGATAGTGVVTTSDDADIDDESFTVGLGTLPEGITAGSPSSVEVTITDNDFRLEASSHTVIEGNSVRVQVLNFPDFTAVESTGTAKLGNPGFDAGTDFAMDPSAVYSECHGSESRPHDCVTEQIDHWGRPRGEGWLTIGTVPDGISEGDETIVLTAFEVLHDNNGRITRGQRTESITITLQDLDPAELILTPSSATLSRDGGPVTVALSLDRPAPQTTAIRITPSGTASILPLGEPHTGHDYEMSPSQGHISVAKGETQGQGELTLTALNDATPGETITLTARSVQAPNRFKQGETTITIGEQGSNRQDPDDPADPRPAARFSVWPEPVPEGSLLGVTLMLSKGLKSEVTLPLVVTRESSEEGDHQMLPLGRTEASVTIPAGHCCQTVAFETAVDDDGDDETFTVALDVDNLPPEVRLGSPSSVTVTIEDDGVVRQPDSGTQQSPPNRAPAVSAPLADATIVNESGTREVSLAGVFSDPDGDALSLRAASSNGAVATASVSSDGSSLTVNAQGRGTATITVIAEDGSGSTAEDSFTVQVKAAPTVSAAIADVSGLEAGDTQEVSLSGAFSDADGDALTITASSSDEAKATVSVASDGSKLTITGVTEGTATVTVTAQDGDGNRVTDVFAVGIVAPPPPATPNRAPTVSSAIADATIPNESGTQTVSLSGVFDDSDNDVLSVAAASDDEAVVTVSVASDGSSLTVAAKSRGTATITVTASDGNGGTVEDSFTVTVKAAPTVSAAIADVSGLKAGSTQEVSLSGAFSDADGDALTITASSNDEAIATVSVAADHSTLTLTGVDEGTATITVTAQDADGNRVSDAFEVSVIAPPQPNQAPTVSAAIADSTIVNESGTKEVSLTGVFSDSDNDALSVTAASSDEAKATVSVASDGSSLTVTAQARGTATITVTAADGRGGTVSDAFAVTVKAAPVVASAIADMKRLETGDTRDVSLSGVFSDADGDALTFTADTSDSAVANAFPFQGTLTIVGLADGSATITVTAQDPDGNAVSYTFDVKVVGPPTPVSNLTCVAQTDWVLFQWDAPEWSGAELYAYDYDLTRPDGRSQQVRLQGYPLVREKGEYQAGQEASISVKAVYELADGSEVYSAAATLTCAVAE